MKTKRMILSWLILVVLIAPLAAGGQQETTSTADDDTSEVQKEASETAKTGISMELVGNMMDKILDGFTTAISPFSIDDDFALRVDVLSTERVSFLRKLIPMLLFMELLWKAVEAMIKETMSSEEIVVTFVKALLIIWFLMFLPVIMTVIQSSFIKWANILAGGTEKTLTRIAPSDFLRLQGTISAPMDDLIASMQTKGFLSKINPMNIALSFVTLLASLIVTFISVFVAVNVMMVYIEFHILLVAAMVLVPWRLFTPTRFVGDRVFPTLIGQGIKIFVITFIYLIMAPAMKGVAGSVTKLFSSATEYTVLAKSTVVIAYIASMTLIYGYLILKGPQIAMALMSGQPTSDTPGSNTIMRAGAAAITAPAALGNKQNQKLLGLFGRGMKRAGSAGLQAFKAGPGKQLSTAIPAAKKALIDKILPPIQGGGSIKD